MDQSRAINALAPFVALAKSATSPRAASDLVTQATSAPNTYVFAELLQQPNVQALAGHDQYGGFHELLKIFAWGTWESYKGNPTQTDGGSDDADKTMIASSGLPQLSDAQSKKLRLLSLLTIAAEKPTSSSLESNLSYSSLCRCLDLESTVDLEHLITEAIYSDLIVATINPASQTIVITSVAPLRDLAPGSVASMISELSAWSGRCDNVLAELEAEIAKVKADAQKRYAREQKAERQIKAVTEASEKGSSGAGLTTSRGGHNTRGAMRRGDDADDDDDAMDVDGGMSAGGKKRSGGGGGIGNLMSRVTRNGR